MPIKEKPIWKEGLNSPSFPKLEKNLSCDVVIIGGGMAGILCAYKLTKAGKKVVLLEANKIGSGATEYTTAFITQVIDTDLSELVKLFGKEKARLVWQSGVDAIDEIEQIVSEEHIDCEFDRAKLVTYINTDQELDYLKKERDFQSQMKFKVGEVITDLSLNFRNQGFYVIPNQAKFHPLKFLYQLATVVTDKEGKIFENSEVVKIQHYENHVEVETKTNQISAKHVVVATYQPFHNRIRLFLKRGMYKSYVFAVKIVKGLIPEGLYQDVENPYHYFRIDQKEDHDRMILGGVDIKSIFKIDPKRSYQALEEYLQEILAGKDYEITHRWEGGVLEPSDGLPLIGETFDREFVASAFSGNGMTYSMIAAMTISDAILGYQNIYASVYDPKRIPSLKQLFMKGSDYIGEFFGGAAKNMFKKKQTI